MMSRTVTGQAQYMISQQLLIKTRKGPSKENSASQIGPGMRPAWPLTKT